MTNAITLRWTPPNARPRRVRFEPRSPGGWTRIEQERTTEGEWRTVGQEIVAGVELEAPAAIVSDRQPSVYHGP